MAPKKTATKKPAKRQPARGRIPAADERPAKRAREASVESSSLSSSSSSVPSSSSNTSQPAAAAEQPPLTPFEQWFAAWRIEESDSGQSCSADEAQSDISDISTCSSGTCLQITLGELPAFKTVFDVHLEFWEPSAPEPELVEEDVLWEELGRFGDTP